MRRPPPSARSTRRDDRAQPVVPAAERAAVQLRGGGGMADIRAANGCVASTTALTWRAARNSNESLDTPETADPDAADG